jgi:hypothetical protein
VGRDLNRRTTGGVNERLHGIYMFLDAVSLGLPVHVYKNVIGVMTGEHPIPVGSIPSGEVEFIHAPQIAGYLVVCHDHDLLPGSFLSVPGVSRRAHSFTTDNETNGHP